MSLYQINELESESAIGIDLGTTNSLVGSYLNDKYQIISFIPSLVSYHNKRVIVGREALNYKNSKQSSFFSSIKRSMSDHDNKIAIEISAEILKKLKLDTEIYLKKPVKNAVITVPAYFDDLARNATKFAAELAGLKVLRLVNEPTAAAIAYGLEKNKNGYFIIYDLGGGTFDVSILKLSDGIFQVLATGGDIKLGGDDFDLLVKNYLKLPSTELARTIKEALSKEDVVTIDDYTLALSQFEELIAPLVKKTTDIIHNVLLDANIEIKDIEGVVLVGGSTRVPLIAKEIRKKFDLKIFSDLNPDEIVAIGATIVAKNLISKNGNLLLDVTPLSLGLELIDGTIEILIPRNTPVPCKMSQEFTTYVDNQTAIKFHILQGERPIASDCKSLAKFELQNIPPFKAGIAKVLVTYTIDVNGILSIDAIEQKTNIKQRIELNTNINLLESEVQQMIINSLKNAKEDALQTLLTKAKFNANQLIETIEKESLLEADKKLITAELTNLRHSLTENDYLKIENFTNLLEQAYQPIMQRKLDNYLENTIMGKSIAEIEKII